MLQGARVTGLSLQRGALMGQGELWLLQPLGAPWKGALGMGRTATATALCGWCLGLALPAAPVDVRLLGTRL